MALPLLPIAIAALAGGQLLRAKAAADLTRRRNAELRQQMAQRADATRRSIDISVGGVEQRYTPAAQMRSMDEQRDRMETDLVQAILAGRQPLSVDQGFQGRESEAFAAERARLAADTLDRARRMARLRAEMQAPGAARFERGIRAADDRLRQMMLAGDTARAADISNMRIAGMQPSGVLMGLGDLLSMGGSLAAGQYLGKAFRGLFAPKVLPAANFTGSAAKTLGAGFKPAPWGM